MDASKLFRNDMEDNILTIDVDGEPTEWHWKRMTYAERMGCLSRALLAAPDGKGEAVLSVDLEKYYMAALMKMVTKGPCPITPASLAALTDEIGSKLQEIVPTPFGAPKMDATIKKE